MRERPPQTHFTRNNVKEVPILIEDAPDSETRNVCLFLEFDKGQHE